MLNKPAIVAVEAENGGQAGSVTHVLPVALFNSVMKGDYLHQQTPSPSLPQFAAESLLPYDKTLQSGVPGVFRYPPLHHPPTLQPCYLTPPPHHMPSSYGEYSALNRLLYPPPPFEGFSRPLSTQYYDSGGSSNPCDPPGGENALCAVCAYRGDVEDSNQEVGGRRYSSLACDYVDTLKPIAGYERQRYQAGGARVCDYANEGVSPQRNYYSSLLAPPTPGGVEDHNPKEGEGLELEGGGLELEGGGLELEGGGLELEGGGLELEGGGLELEGGGTIPPPPSSEELNEDILGYAKDPSLSTSLNRKKRRMEITSFDSHEDAETRQKQSSLRVLASSNDVMPPGGATPPSDAEENDEATMGLSSEVVEPIVSREGGGGCALSHSGGGEEDEGGIFVNGEKQERKKEAIVSLLLSRMKKGGLSDPLICMLYQKRRGGLGCVKQGDDTLLKIRSLRDPCVQGGCVDGSSATSHKPPTGVKSQEFASSSSLVDDSRGSCWGLGEGSSFSPREKVGGFPQGGLSELRSDSRLGGRRNPPSSTLLGEGRPQESKPSRYPPSSKIAEHCGEFSSASSSGSLMLPEDEKRENHPPPHSSSRSPPLGTQQELPSIQPPRSRCQVSSRATGWGEEANGGGRDSEATAGRGKGEEEGEKEGVEEGEAVRRLGGKWGGKWRGKSGVVEEGAAGGKPWGKSGGQAGAKAEEANKQGEKGNERSKDKTASLKPNHELKEEGGLLPPRDTQGYYHYLDPPRAATILRFRHQLSKDRALHRMREWDASRFCREANNQAYKHTTTTPPAFAWGSSKPPFLLPPLRHPNSWRGEIGSGIGHRLPSSFLPHHSHLHQLAQSHSFYRGRGGKVILPPKPLTHPGHDGATKRKRGRPPRNLAVADTCMPSHPSSPPQKARFGECVRLETTGGGQGGKHVFSPENQLAHDRYYPHHIASPRKPYKHRMDTHSTMPHLNFGSLFIADYHNAYEKPPRSDKVDDSQEKNSPHTERSAFSDHPPHHIPPGITGSGGVWKDCWSPYINADFPPADLYRNPPLQIPQLEHKGSPFSTCPPEVISRRVSSVFNHKILAVSRARGGGLFGGSHSGGWESTGGIGLGPIEPGGKGLLGGSAENEQEKPISMRFGGLDDYSMVEDTHTEKLLHIHSGDCRHIWELDKVSKAFEDIKSTHKMKRIANHLMSFSIPEASDRLKLLEEAGAPLSEECLESIKCVDRSFEWLEAGVREGW